MLSVILILLPSFTLSAECRHLKEWRRSGGSVKVLLHGPSDSHSKVFEQTALRPNPKGRAECGPAHISSRTAPWNGLGWAEWSPWSSVRTMPRALSGIDQWMAAFSWSSRAARANTGSSGSGEQMGGKLGVIDRLSPCLCLCVVRGVCVCSAMWVCVCYPL